MGAIEEIEAQGTLEPGQDGWWRVWGASILDVKAGDVVIDTEGAYEVHEVTGRTLTQVVLQTSEGEICVGMMARINVVRKTTHNTLADTCGDGFAARAKYLALPEVGKGEPEAEVAPEPEPAPAAPTAEPQPIEGTPDVYTPTDAQTKLVSFLAYATADASLALPHVFRLLETTRRSGWAEETNSAGDTRVRVENAGLGYYRLAYTSLAVRYTASITPEEWQNDQAVEVDAPGEQTWDCTAYALANLDYLTDLEARSGDRLADPYGIVDGDDLFKSDPAAPSWVSGWSGPFTLRVTRQR